MTTLESPEAGPSRLRKIALHGLLVIGLLAASSAAPAVAARGGSGGPDACGSAIYKQSGGRWNCTFVDNFSSTSLDSTKWLAADTSTSGFTMDNTCFTPNNVTIANGVAQLSVRDAGAPFTCSSPYGTFTTQYTGGAVSTAGRFSQTGGRFEVRARYPQAVSGAHGGFWMHPKQLTYGAWPASGEIDVAEWWSQVPNTVLPTLHYSGSTASDSGTNCTVADPTQWHTYNVVWTSTQMVFSIDGTPCFTRSWTPNAPLVAPQPFDQPFNLVLTFGGTVASTYQVDYVKAWS